MIDTRISRVGRRSVAIRDKFACFKINTIDIILEKTVLTFI